LLRDGLNTQKKKVGCQDVSLPKGFDMRNRPKLRIRLVDYHEMLYAGEIFKNEQYRKEVLT
jgi:hypothetical protein